MPSSAVVVRACSIPPDFVPTECGSGRWDDPTAYFWYDNLAQSLEVSRREPTAIYCNQSIHSNAASRSLPVCLHSPLSLVLRSLAIPPELLLRFQFAPSPSSERVPKRVSLEITTWTEQKKKKKNPETKVDVETQKRSQAWALRPNG